MISFNECKVVPFDNLSTIEEAFDDIHNSIPDGIQYHVFSVVTHGNFGGVITDDPKEYVYYIVKFNNFPYTLKYYVIFDRIII